jgi:hypothetical protein
MGPVHSSPPDEPVQRERPSVSRLHPDPRAVYSDGCFGYSPNPFGLVPEAARPCSACGSRTADA